MLETRRAKECQRGIAGAAERAKEGGRVPFESSDTRLCDTAHRIERDGAETMVFDKGADSVDFALVNRVRPGDVVITQDYGLAAMCLSRRARVLNQNGLEYTADNIEGLLEQRHHNKKLLRAGKHLKGPAKRTKEQDEAFGKTLERVLRTSC